MTEGGAAASSAAPNRARRSKSILLILILLTGAVALAGATQNWVDIRLIPGEAAVDRLGVTGQKLNPSLSPIALAALAAALVLTIAGPAFRRVLGVLVLLFGAGIATLGINAQSAPRDAARGAVASATGLTGEAQYTVVASVVTTPWPLIVTVCGIVLALAGLAVVLVSGRWKSGGRKYEAQSARSARGPSEDGPDRIADWDALSDGDDPTRAP